MSGDRVVIPSGISVSRPEIQSQAYNRLEVVLSRLVQVCSAEICPELELAAAHAAQCD